MPRKRTNVIWSLSKDEFRALVERSKTQKEILEYFGLKNKGSSHETLKKRFLEDNIDDSHLMTGADMFSERNRKRKIPLNECLVENSTYARSDLKRRLLEDGILHNECSECGQGPEWNGKPIIMVLDHINGVSNDNRLPNLRMVCPNCNSQLPTHGGRNCRRSRTCNGCGKDIQRKNKSGLCVACCKPKKVKRPSMQQIRKEVGETSFSAVGRKYGVSDNAIRKWLR